ncbi:MAG: hypothetical protein KGK34_06200 [Chloroflexota bacterium]|nr:hypothetical protein [Chloroflexota bacterium]
MTDATAPTPTPAPAPTPAWRPRRRGFLFPALLILVGGLFFLGNLGYLPPMSWHGVLSLWPIVLVLFGIELIVARRQPFVALALEIVVVVASVALVAMQPYGLLAPAVGGTAGSSFTVSRDNARTLQLRVEGGAGSYSLEGGSSSLLDVRSTGGQVAVQDHRSGDLADIRIEPADVGDIFRFGGRPPENVDVRVAGDVPTSLRVSGGAGDFTVDLRGMRIQSARVDTGASRLDLTLPTPSGEVPVTVSAGAASVTIVVPDDVEARVVTTGGVMSVTTLNPRLGSGTSSGIARPATIVETAGYATAKDRVTVTVSAGASSITIR